MSEVINLSLSQRANHLLAHLYNNQEAHLPYSKTATVDYDNSVFLSTSKNPNGTVNYSPRSLNYDLTRGYGSLGKYEYYESKADILGQYEVIQTGEKMDKNEYQKALDKGMNKSNTLNVNNTKYWTDYNKLIYSPKSLNQLNNWEYKPHDFGINRSFPNLKFDTFNKGKEEYHQYSEDSLENFRNTLEECDLIQGVNLISELDSAWGGFTNELLVDLKDEFFNNGINSKYNIWVHGLINHNLNPKLNQLYSRINSIIELSFNSTLFFPMNLNSSSECLGSGYDETSEWHNSSIHAIFLNSIWGLNNQIKNPVKMSVIEDELLRGFDKRNIVNEIKIHKNKQASNDFGMVDIDRASLYNLVDNIKIKDKPDSIDLSLSDSKNSKYFAKSYIIPNDQSLAESLNKKENFPINIYKNNRINDILNNDTFPNILEDKSVYSEFSSSNTLKNDLKFYREVIKRSRENEVIEDKFELIEKISELIEEYTIGYDESDEEYDSN